MAIQNMARQHREFQSLLDDAKKLRLYAQSAVFKHLAKVESKLKHWKREAKAGAEKIEQVEKERDEAKARVEDDLTRARDALAGAEEDGRRLEAEVARMVVE